MGFKVYAKSALREALHLVDAAIGGFRVQIGQFRTLNQRVPGSGPGAPTIKALLDQSLGRAAFREQNGSRAKLFGIGRYTTGPGVDLILCFCTFTHSIQRGNPMVQADHVLVVGLGYKSEQNGQSVMPVAAGY
ncbi:hypothetical protein [Bradyrhizobium sp. CCBAU 51627]|uniref:hypothetical protein n=1 Tax=Bradyrhizobium sp. CCBAU 51627 TaxID=1325088 RepID=UPI002304E78F|nr:hypothetical protein [Bradyrhizobium sp. CCBAU 51627]